MQQLKDIYFKLQVNQPMCTGRCFYKQRDFHSGDSLHLCNSLKWIKKIWESAEIWVQSKLYGEDVI